MPTLSNARIGTDGHGAIGFVAEAVGAPLLTTATANAATVVAIAVSGENIGNGIGFYAGLTSRPPITTLLQFKSLLAGPGIILTDIGDTILLTTNAASPRFIDLGDGPGQILGAGALLIGNTVANALRWTTAPSLANSALTWTGDALTWVPITALTTLIGIGDGAIAVTMGTVANTQSISISLGNTAVVAGSYTAPSFRVDAQGRITSITSTEAPFSNIRFVGDGAVQVTVAPLGGALANAVNNTVVLALTNTTVVAGSYSFPTLTVDAQGRITAITSNLSSLLTITGDAAIGVAGPTLLDSTVALSLRPSGVAAGTYAYATVTVDATGRLTAVTAGTPISRLDANSDANLTISGAPLTGAGTLTIGMALTAVAAGTYSLATVVVDRFGRLQNAISGALPGAQSVVGIQANTTNVVSLYAGANGTVSYVSALLAGPSISLTLSNTTLFAGQTLNSGVITIDLAATGTPGTYNQVVVNSRGLVIGGLATTPQISLTNDVTGTSNATGVIQATLAPSGVLAGSYTQVTVDSKGRVTNGSFSNGVASTTLTVTGDVTGAGLLSANLALTLNTVVAAGSYAQVTVDSKGRVIGGVAATAISAGFINLSGAVSAFGNSTANTAVVTTLANSGVTAGVYNQVTVNNKGLVTNGVALAVSVTLTNDVLGTSNASGTLVATLANSGVVAGSYTQVTVDSKGRVITGSFTNSAASTTLTVQGDVAGTGLLSAPLTLLLANVVTAGTYNLLAVDTKGRVTAGSLQAYLTSTSSIALAQLPAAVIDTSISFSFSGLLGPGQQASIPLLINLALPASLIGSVFYCGVRPAATAVFTLQYVRNAITTTIALISVNTFGVFSVSASGALNLNAGDIMLLLAPSTQDATLQNVGLSILSTKR